jgi:glycosyltransferase involved in cell wall biosynthesis
MRFSLVLATIGRVSELERFLQALDAQTYRDFELIVVDQNPDDRLVPILQKYQGRFPLIHLRSQQGLSRARNVGLKHLSGEMVAFPDDDCWYPPDLLEQVKDFRDNQPDWDGILGKLVWDNIQVREDRLSTPNLVDIFNATTSVDAVNLLQTLMPKEPPVSTSSATLFLTSESLDTVNGFDEELGLGSGTDWGGGDDIDIVVRCLKSGFKICHKPTLKVYHPDPRRGYNDVSRGFFYGAGMGRVLRKHDYPSWFVVYHLLRSLGAAGLDLVCGQMRKARYHKAVFRGKFAGWRSNAKS